MKKINAHAGRLALKKETVRRLGGHDLDAVSAGWECSVTGSGKIMCNAPADADAMADKTTST